MNDILITFDEMQAGCSRTGKNFGFQHYDITPDLICCGKGMGSGFPIAGVITSKKIMDNKFISGLSSTHSANPIACEAGSATLDYLKNETDLQNINKLRLLFQKVHKKLCYG